MRLIEDLQRAVRQDGSGPLYVCLFQVPSHGTCFQLNLCAGSR